MDKGIPGSGACELGKLRQSCCWVVGAKESRSRFGTAFEAFGTQSRSVVTGTAVCCGRDICRGPPSLVGCHHGPPKPAKP